MLSRVFVLASEAEYYENRYFRFCHNVFPGSLATLASLVSTANPVDFFGKNSHRHDLCLVGFPTLPIGLLHWLVMDERNRQDDWR